MTTFFDSADADICGPNCECDCGQASESEYKAARAKFDQIVLDCEDCVAAWDCLACEEILFVAKTAYETGIDDGIEIGIDIALDSAEEQVAKVTSEAVKSTLDSISYAGINSSVKAVGGSSLGTVSVQTVSAPGLQDLQFSIDDIWDTIQYVEERQATLAKRAQTDDAVIAESLYAVAEVADAKFEKIAKGLDALIADIKALEERQDADSLYLDAIGDRLLLVENQQKGRSEEHLSRLKSGRWS